jgi:hypothetical protein
LAYRFGLESTTGAYVTSVRQGCEFEILPLNPVLQTEGSDETSVDQVKIKRGQNKSLPVDEQTITMSLMSCLPFNKPKERPSWLCKQLLAYRFGLESTTGAYVTSVRQGCEFEILPLNPVQKGIVCKKLFKFTNDFC